MEISTEKYPVFRNRIYKNPDGGIVPNLLCEEGVYDFGDTNAILIGTRATPWANVNEAGAKLLSECNGEKTIGDMIAQVYGEESEKMRDTVLQFFKNISLQFTIEFCDSPSSCKVKSYGTVECYYPLRVVGEVTTRCNLTCQHCSNASGRGGVDMKKGDLFRIVDRLSEEGILNFDITGGEPFVRKDVLEIAEKCCNTFYDVTIATNGTLIGKEEAAALAEFSNLSVIVSLDSHTSQFHDKFRGVDGAFKKAVSGIKNCVSEGIYTRIAATFTYENFGDFKQILHLVDELMVDGFNYDVVRGTGRGVNLDVRPEDDIKWMAEVDSIANEELDNEMMTVFSERLRTTYTQNCGAGKTMWTFAPDGNVRPCCVLDEKYVVCGNLLREDFHEIFSREPAVSLSKMKSPCEEMCGDCKYLPHCSECICNGILMYKRIGDTCMWGSKTKISNWVNLTEDRGTGSF
jgi:radical SAM protein with 4Fe4S-binding SPASM domain